MTKLHRKTKESLVRNTNMPGSPAWHVGSPHGLWRVVEKMHYEILYGDVNGHVEWTANVTPPVKGVSTTSFPSSGVVTMLKMSASTIYAVTSEGDIYAFDITSGKQLWNKSLIATDVTPVELSHQSQELFAYGGTPVSNETQNTNNEQAFIEKLDPQTGKVIWQTQEVDDVNFPMQG